MGDPVDPIIIYGDDCGTCTPSVWEPGHTPFYLSCTLAGIVKCPGYPLLPAPLNGTFIMHQISNCAWNFSTDSWALNYEAGPVISRLYLMYTFLYYFAATGGACGYEFTNLCTCLPGDIFSRASCGTAKVDLSGSPSLASMLGINYAMANRLPSKSEYHYNDEAQEYVSLCSYKDKTRIRILYDGRLNP